MNIIDNLVSVNINNLTEAEKTEHIYNVLAEIVKRQSGYDLSNPDFTAKDDIKNNNFQSLKKEPENKMCPFSVRKDFCYKPSDVKLEKKKKRKPEEKFDYLYEVQDKPKDFFSMIPETYNQILEHMNFIVVDSYEKKYIMAPNEKGSPAYNKWVRAKLMHYATIFHMYYVHTYFLTLTVDLKRFAGGVIDQHKMAVKKLGLFVQKLCSTFGGRYIYVSEEQKRGAIHFHIEFFTDRDLHTGNMRHTKNGKKEYIGKGKLREFCEKRWPWGYFDLQHGEGEKIIRYLTKYVSKETEADFWRLKNNKKPKGESWKAMLGFVMPTVCGYRTYNTSHLNAGMKVEYEKLQKEWENRREEYKAKKIKESALKNPKTRFKPLNDYVAERKVVIKKLPEKKSLPPRTQLEIENDRLRSYLIYISDNSTVSCLKWLYSGKYGDLANKYGTDFRKINELSDSEKEKIALGCSSLGCGGCVFGQIVRDFITKDVKTFSKGDNRDALKPFLWKVLTKEDREYFMSFNFSSKTEVDTTVFEELFEKIGDLLTEKTLNSNLSKWEKAKDLSYLRKGEKLSLNNWRRLLCWKKQEIFLEGDSNLKVAARNLFPTNTVPIFNSLTPQWVDTGFDEVFDLFKEWLEEQGIFASPNY